MLFGGGPLGTANNELYKASFDAYNRWLADFCAHAPKRFAGVGYVPMQDVDDAIAMMRDFAARGLKAVNIPAFPMAPVASAERRRRADAGADRRRQRRSQLCRSRVRSVLEGACDLGMPVTIHLGGRAVRFTNPKFFLSDLLMSKFGMGEPIAIMIYGGVFQRFPDLKLVSVESGVGWFAFAANYMDETWQKQRYWVNTVLEREPSYFWEQQHIRLVHSRSRRHPDARTARARATSCGRPTIRTRRPLSRNRRPISKSCSKACRRKIAT